MVPGQARGLLTRRLCRAGYEAHGSWDLRDQANVCHQALVMVRSDFRLRWFATSLNTVVVVFPLVNLTEDRARALTAAAHEQAIRDKDLLSPKTRLPSPGKENVRTVRGFHTATATVVVFLSDTSSPSLPTWFSLPERRRSRWSPRPRSIRAWLTDHRRRLQAPVLLEVESQTLTYLRERRYIASLYAERLRDAVEEDIAPAFPLNGDRDASASEIARYAAYRAQIEHEDHLLGTRVGWLIASEAFLFAAYAAATKPDFKGSIEAMSAPGKSDRSHLIHDLANLARDLDRLIQLLPYVGIAIALLVYAAIIAAVRALQQQWKRGETLPGFPPVIGDKSTHRFGLAPPLVIPPVLILAWVQLGYGHFYS